MQECFSILSGFTLAKCLNIDVSSIPPAVYPFVVLVVGLENMLESAFSLLATESNLI